MLAGLKSPCGSHVAQQVPLLSVGLQDDIQTMPLFPSVFWVWWNRNQSLKQPLGKRSQNVAHKFHFSLMSQGRNWELGGFLQTVSCQGGGLGRGRQKHHYISYPFECGSVELRKTVSRRLKVLRNSVDGKLF